MIKIFDVINVRRISCQISCSAYLDMGVSAMCCVKGAAFSKELRRDIVLENILYK